MKVKNMIPESYVFGYGSLVDTSSAAATLGRKLTDYTYAELKNFTRSFSAYSEVNSAWDKYAKFAYTYTDNIGVMHIPVFNNTYLNIVPDPAESVTGIIFKVNAKEMARIKARESLYEMVDVTHLVDLDTKGIPIFTFICKPQNTIPHDDFPSCVASYYYDTVEAAHSKANLADEFDRQCSKFKHLVYQTNLNPALGGY